MTENTTRSAAERLSEDALALQEAGAEVLEFERFQLA